MSRNITIVTVGSRGDAQPYVALGQALAARGHRVTVATHETFRGMVTGRGLAFELISGDPRAVLASESADRWLSTGGVRDMVGAVRRFAREARPIADALLGDFWRVTAGADVIVYSAVAVACRQVARARGVPSVAAFLQPLHATSAFPAIGLPSSLRLGGAFNLSTYAVVDSIVWRLFRQQVDDWRRSALGLGPLSAPTSDPADWHVPAVYGFSPAVMPPPADWRRDVVVTGYWVLEPEADWQPPAVLGDFLAAGPPPVAIGFGSMTPHHAERLTGIALDALRQSGQRGILLGGWGALGMSVQTDDVLTMHECPHEWLFPRTAAVVHHGGAGTTGASIRGGTPSILVPLGFDQPFWASRVVALGVGPRSVRRRKLTAAWLAAAIRQAVGDQPMRARAAVLGATLRAETGAATAASIIESISESAAGSPLGALVR
jgi:UDP:flavonoid glycosyltransferase YjiC (YdhE family)